MVLGALSIQRPSISAQRCAVIYALSAMAVFSAAMAFLRPSIWSMFAASVLNLAMAWLLLGAYLSG